MQRRGYTFVEVLVVVVLAALVIAFAARTFLFLAKESAQVSPSALSTKRAEFDQFVGILNDRLSQAWSYLLEDDPAPPSGYSGKKRTLKDNDGNPYFSFGLYTSGLTCLYQIQDLGTTYTQNPLTNSYSYTDSVSIGSYAITANSDGYVLWKIPPPPTTTWPASTLSEVWSFTTTTPT